MSVSIQAGVSCLFCGGNSFLPVSLAGSQYRLENEVRGSVIWVHVYVCIYANSFA